MLIGEILVSQRIITLKQLENALENQRASGERLGDILIELEYATYESIENAVNSIREST